MHLRICSALILLSTFLQSAPLLKKPSIAAAARHNCKKAKQQPSVQRQLAVAWHIDTKIKTWYTTIKNTLHALEICLHQQPTISRTTIKVLLDEQRVGTDACSWDLLSTAGFIVGDYEQGTRYMHIAKPAITITYKQGNFYIDKKRIDVSALHIMARDGTITCNNIAYHGDFLLLRYKQRILCINMIEIESYVGSVLHSESWPGWPTEVNKVFAIMCRSYALSHMLSAESMGRPYHIRNTNKHQNYHGIHKNTVIHDAVQQTTGMILIYDQRPILAMFDACCGGIIPAHIGHGIDFKKEPYLARKYACTFCKSCRLYEWKKSMTIAEFERHLHSAALCHGTVHDLSVVSRDRAGLPKKVHVKTKRGVAVCNGKQLYSALPDIKSYAFSLKKHGDQVHLSGYGYGHHIGVCQWGAREMVRLGYTFIQILSFYYPGTTLTCIV